MVDSKDKPDDQIDRASKLRNMREARVNGSNDPVKFRIDDYRECGFDKSTDFMAHDKASSTVTKDEWLLIKAAVTAGFSEDEQRVLAANIYTLSESEKALRTLAKQKVNSKIKDFKNTMIRRERKKARGQHNSTWTQVRRSIDQVTYDTADELITKLERAINRDKEISFDSAKVMDWLKAIKKETRPS